MVWRAGTGGCVRLPCLTEGLLPGSQRLAELEWAGLARCAMAAALETFD